jgi:hypothetical protein
MKDKRIIIFNRPRQIILEFTKLLHMKQKQAIEKTKVSKEEVKNNISSEKTYERKNIGKKRNAA